MLESAPIITIDDDTGLLTADATMSLWQINEAIAPHHVLPVVPDVVPDVADLSFAEAIANDVIGMNHQRRGSFGAHVKQIELYRSDRYGPIRLSADDRMFSATVGGMGMTGTILRATIRCLRVPSQAVRRTTVRLANLTETLARSSEAQAFHEYAAAWIDSQATGERLGRGHLLVGDHVMAPDVKPPRRLLPIRAVLPVAAAYPLTIKAANAISFARVPPGGASAVLPAASFFHPPESVRRRNRNSGPRRRRRHQSILPEASAAEAVARILRITQRNQGALATRVARLGVNRSPGFMSFARPGILLTLIIADRGAETRTLLEVLDGTVLAAGGAINPHQDDRISAAAFDRSMPGWRDVDGLRDPAIVSDFWARTAMALPRQATEGVA